MELKPGYKLTELGTIPKDWRTPELGGILKSMQLGGNYKNSGRETNWPLIKMGNLGRGSIKLDKLEFIDTSQPPSVRDRLEKEDILFNTRNTLELVGKVAIWRNELPEAYFNSNIMRMDFDKEWVSSPSFMNYILNTPQALKSLRGVAIGTTSVAAIYSRDLVKIKIPLPTKTEQEAIADVLSGADTLIESLEQLIAKKRQVKQGAMQELLTGKRRLPGFGNGKQSYRQTKFGMMPSDWTPTPLKQVSSFITKGSTPTTYGFSWQNDGVLFLRSECVSEHGLDLSQSMFISNAAHQFLRRSEVQSGDILMTITGNVGRVILLGNDLSTANINQHIARIRINNDQIAATFLFHFLSQPMVRRYYNLITTGQAYPQISLSQVRETEVPMPQFDEQIAIVEILSDMDTEIAALETKLTKARQIKQGMMQELLTGRIRLL
ncbi:restriction endonuclease subunit S [Methylomicrobium sp. Wu6]|uniref:restriction endonuclease subunit S n=1 Tax=Methylomicrobium sp. Wu6 TaxID=3107928 RepID=UPI002DD69BE8|nr:restriction endonuclease subunit S [Methylomicrobium sp. Wu6]MEC4747166.1 restriction endonuclease subunit S [Methylomicrobium sp. Wu6]